MGLSSKPLFLLGLIPLTKIKDDNLAFEITALIFTWLRSQLRQSPASSLPLQPSSRQYQGRQQAPDSWRLSQNLHIRSLSPPPRCGQPSQPTTCARRRAPPGLELVLLSCRCQLPRPARRQEQPGSSH